ncbi:MAG: TIGR00282 family metallophosphoesterase [Candidatus Hydrogenedens sp.]|nr:TIGR00282 family metallophosphoesterase [Candidatus Hydrogenedens sp.]
MKILFVGDVVGRPGRLAVAKQLPALRRARAVDVVVANAENAAGGHGATPEILRELQGYGVDAFTMGNHTWRKHAIYSALDSMPNIVRPANYPEGAPGRGAAVIKLRDGRKLGILNIMGRVYMEPLECPFRAADRLLPGLREETPLILVDVHAEATSEKVAMGWHLDGRCTAALGTHTHVQTGDEWILPGGTAYLTDTGMCGPMFSVIGTEREPVLKRFLTGLPQSFNVAKGPAMFCAVLVEADEETGQARSIERILIRNAG